PERLTIGEVRPANLVVTWVLVLYEQLRQKDGGVITQYRPVYSSVALTALAWLSTLLSQGGSPARAADSGDAANLAAVAKASSSLTSGDTTVDALNNGDAPRSSRDNRRGSYGNWPQRGTQWVEYEWSQPISTNKVDVYWWDDRQGVGWPQACRLLYW